MTHISFSKRGSKFVLLAKGHATTDSGREEDCEGLRVCAALSMLTSTLALSLETIPGAHRHSVHVDTAEGYAKVSARGQGAVKILFQSAYCGAVALQINYPDRVKVQADKFFQKILDSLDAFS